MAAPWFHLLFLATLALCAAGALLWRGRRAGTHGWGLAAFLGAALAALLLHQACWQLSGCGSTAFQKFQRRYDARPATLARVAQNRGRLLDRNGAILAEAEPGQRWGLHTPLGPATLHTIGYASREYGLSGLTRVYDAPLCGFAEPTAAGDLLRRATPQDIRLTLDARYQRLAQEALAGRKGAVIMLDPRDGAILALVSSPSAEPSALRAAMRDRANAPLFNRATQGLYPPGSVLKPLTAALALERGKAGRYVCPARGWAPAAYTKPIRDTHTHPPEADTLDLPTAFAESSNIWFAKAATACGWPAFRDALTRCGLDQGYTLARSGRRLYASEPGHLPNLDAAPNRVAYLGFGQGDLLLTPLHIAALTAALANDGTLAPPHLGPGAPTAPKRIFSPTVARHVRALMRRSVTHGTSRAIAIPGLPVAGKTGTAETSGPDHAWFTCYAPADNPQIVITVLIEHGGFGAATALPIAKRLLQTWKLLTATPSTP